MQVWRAFFEHLIRSSSHSPHALLDTTHTHDDAFTCTPDAFICHDLSTSSHLLLYRLIHIYTRPIHMTHSHVDVTHWYVMIWAPHQTKFSIIYFKCGHDAFTYRCDGFICRHDALVYDDLSTSLDSIASFTYRHDSYTWHIHMQTWRVSMWWSEHLIRLSSLSPHSHVDMTHLYVDMTFSYVDMTKRYVDKTHSQVWGGFD